MWDRFETYNVHLSSLTSYGRVIFVHYDDDLWVIGYTDCNSLLLNSSSSADMVKLADTLDLGSSIERCAGSTPVIRTIIYIILYINSSLNILKI